MFFVQRLIPFKEAECASERRLAAQKVLPVVKCVCVPSLSTQLDQGPVIWPVVARVQVSPLVSRTNIVLPLKICSYPNTIASEQSMVRVVCGDERQPKAHILF